MAAIEVREAGRFLISGGLSTVCNLAAVWIARGLMPYSAALICGIIAGLVSSFLLSKFFAFRSRGIRGVRGEAGRFLLVYGGGVVIYYVVALLSRNGLIRAGQSADVADLAGVLLGGGCMAVTGYLGHRFFTYRTATGGS